MQDLLTYWPLGLIGLWRWIVWMIKFILASRYRPYPTGYRATVSIVVPVYNEDPEHFKTAVMSWVRNKPYEIIAVIDHSDVQNIEWFKRFAQSFRRAKLVVTKTPGKRPALKDGAYQANGKIIAFVDSDTVWEQDTMKQALAAFADYAVGAVATRQASAEARTPAQRYQNILWQMRYLLEMKALVVGGMFFERLFPQSFLGPAITCASGRTAFYRREALMPVIDGLVTEEFFGEKCISGDDKYLTTEVQRDGWTVWYQDTAMVYTFAVPNLKELWKQQLRWARNSWRSDLQAIFSSWIRHRPALWLYDIDRCIAPFTLLLGPIFFVVSLIKGDWVIAAGLLLWWLASRSGKLGLHLKERPRDALFILWYTLLSFASAVIKIHALSTIKTQGWITRWDPTRNPIANLRGKLLGPALTAGFLVILFVFVLFY